VPNSYLRETVDHWLHGFDWRAQEERMNAWPHYLTEIDGQTIHFLHVPSAEAQATRCCCCTRTRDRSSTSWT
jgi:hypothetical protein